jgi:CDP-glucose 4,6-dehydratase
MDIRRCTLEEVVVNSNFWKNKKVLLTGHTGFKGSWLSIWLKKLGVELIGFSKDIPTEPSLFELAKVSEDMKSIIGDIRDFSVIQKIIQENQPEIIIHMAAQALVRKSYEDPIDTFSTNIMGTVNLLESLKQSKKTRVVINVTSDKCYENKGIKEKFSENSPMGGYDPYSNSKACSELVTSSYRDSFFNPKEYQKHGVSLATCRAGNVIGGGDWSKDRLIPDIMRGILNNEIIKIRNPNAIRPWQHVLDPLNGYLTLAEKMWSAGNKFSEGWNFGPLEEDEKSVIWIAKKLTKQWSNGIKWSIEDNINPHEENSLRLNCIKANSRLGWISKLNLEQGLEWVVEWYKQYKQNNNMKKITEQQIEEFQKLK